MRLISSGPYHVGLNIKTLTDESRWDPYAPIDSPQKRRVLISAFTPINIQDNSCSNGEVNVPYMPPKTRDVFGRQAEAMGLPSGVFEDLQLKFCRLPDASRLQGEAQKSGTKLPVVIFSPGRGVSRLMYSAMARSVASHGYVVITVDHAHDASIIEYPDGSAITGVVGEANQTVLETSAKVRSQDISFIIDLIKDNATAREQFGLSGTGGIFVFGHSIGGATAVSTLFSEDRIQGAINLDGDMLGPVVKTGLAKPLFLIGRPHSREQGPSWNETWNNQDGTGMMLQIDDTTHQSFMDAPLLKSNSNRAMAPTIFVVPGFYEGPMVFQPLANNFNERGFKTVITTISSTGKTPTDSPTMDDDIANIAKDFVPVVDEAGEEGVIAVMHSAGGFIGSGALKGLAFKARQDAGKAGGVKKIVFIAAGVAPEGFEQGPVPFFDYHERFARLAGSEKVRVGAGHMVQLSQTEKVADIIALHAN
ncbi:paf acetylhydrolase family [Fusarium acutatum]|uniref:1-alkyl-2-acetylglycerophosphocholine esterase n=1 Tax=Fusarium acutatum TaxID=78861 RepID=A0A8H4K595_9HYPO|nr:paf acetylhydrolase family [Fusarium acutatum]